jgi:hypothetical protein
MDESSGSSPEMEFAILGNLQLSFRSSSDDYDNSVVWCPVHSNLQEGDGGESVEEFALTNFTGRLVIKRRNNRVAVAVAVREELNTLASLPPRLISAMKGSMPAGSAAKSPEKQESIRFDDDSSYLSAKEEDECRWNADTLWGRLGPPG